MPDGRHSRHATPAVTDTHWASTLSGARASAPQNVDTPHHPALKPGARRPGLLKAEAERWRRPAARAARRLDLDVAQFGTQSRIGGAAGGHGLRWPVRLATGTRPNIVLLRTVGGMSGLVAVLTNGVLTLA